MELTYKVADTIKLFHTFAEISRKKDNPEEVFEEMKILVEYPPSVINAFLKGVDICDNVIKNKGEDFMKDNPEIILGYITMIINMAAKD